MHPSPLASLVASLVVGPALGPRTPAPLRFFPLLSPHPREAITLPFAEAVAHGAEARELPEPVVGRVVLHNPLDRPIVLYQGDLISGAQQDRIAAHTVIVPPRSALQAEVCCVEQGRWDGGRRAEAFTAREFSAPASMLRAMHTHVRAKSDTRQRRVWSDVETIVGQTRARTATTTLTHSFEQNADAIEALLEGIDALPDQVGVAVAIGDRLEHVVVVEAPAAYASLHRRLARGHALEVLRSEHRRGARCCVSRAEVAAVVRRLGALPLAPAPTQAAKTTKATDEHATRLTVAEGASHRAFEGDLTLHAEALVHLSLHTPTQETLATRGVRARTSLTDPLAVGWLDLDLPGRAGLTFAPGKRAPSAFGKPWVRDLELDLLRLRHTHGAQHLVCLLTERELRALHLEGYPDAVREHGFVLHHLPIVDGRVPADPPAFRALLAKIAAAVRDGETVVAHCRGGLGRAGLFGGCLAVELGATGEQALALVRRARGRHSPENDLQRAFVRHHRPAEAA